MTLDAVQGDVDPQGARGGVVAAQRHVTRDGQVLGRFRPRIEPEDASITEAIEAALR